MARTESAASGGAPPPARPLFFVSHAGPDDPADDALFARFFADLSREVAARLAVDGAGLGYMLDPAAGAREAARALDACRVFVPLWSPRYFRTARCGREWSYFLERVHAAPHAAPERHFAPVTWAPVSAAVLPAAAREVDRGGRREERPDTMYGLYTLIPEAPAAGEGAGDPEELLYREVVAEVAGAVARASGEALAPAGALDLAAVPNAFALRTHELSLRVAILAPSTRTLPQGRAGKGRYGTQPLDWAPYGNCPLAEDAARITARLGYELHLVDFDEAEGTLLAEPPGEEPEPTLLLIDNWSLLDEDRRRAVAAYARPDRPWQMFMVVRDADDPETRDHIARLRAVVDETLAARLDRMRVDHRHAASGDGSREGFPRDFSMLAQAAESSFLRR